MTGKEVKMETGHILGIPKAHETPAQTCFFDFQTGEVVTAYYNQNPKTAKGEVTRVIVDQIVPINETAAGTTKTIFRSSAPLE